MKPMKWSAKIGEFAGIPVYVHATFLLLIAWVAFIHWGAGHSFALLLQGVLFILLLFVCVILHEFGHALTAKKYGIRTRDITLLPIGGLARFERMPDDPRQELLVALAGPAVNVVIAAALWVWLVLTGGMEPFSAMEVTSGSLAQRLLLVNVVLVIFNMLPAFPMDGGRVLRALLAMRMEYTRATQIASSIGQALAFFFGFVGLFTNPFLVFIALFVWIGAAQEASMVQMKSALGGIPVQRAMLTRFQTLAPRDTLAHAVDLILAGSQQDFPVMADSRVVGILTRSALVTGLAKQGSGAAVEAVMRREFETADSSEMLEPVFVRLQSCDCRTVPVVHEGKLVGLVTMDNIGEFIAIQAALGKERVALPA